VPKNQGGSPSLDGVGRGADDYIAKLKKTGEISSVRRAVKHAKVSQCPSAKLVHHLYSTSSKKAYEIPCGSWTCSFCGWKKQKVASYLVLAGMLEANKEGKRVRFLTLTEDPKKPMQIADLSSAWNRMRTRLKDEGKLDQYASVVECTSRGRPHLHVVFTGEFVPQRKLSGWAETAGFGRVADIRQVDFDAANQEGSKRAASYVAKELAGYVSKAKGDGVGKLVAKRRRPLRTSRGWYPGGMKRAEDELLQSVWSETGFEPDEGDFFFVIGADGETLRISGRTPTGETFSTTDKVERKKLERLPAQRSSLPREERSKAAATKKAETERGKGKRKADLKLVSEAELTNGTRKRRGGKSPPAITEKKAA